MISCTEFIPLYSEFFKYLEKLGGKDAVMEYWIHISDTSIGDVTNPNSLAYKCEKLGGFEGAIAYWGHTLTEEACDLFEMEDRWGRVKYSHMRHCPSRGMLNALTHVTPYDDYCSHCNVIYARVLEKYGVTYERDNSEIANAECRGCFYENGNPPAFNFRTVTDEELKKRSGEPGISIIDMKSDDNKYLHRDFHLLGDNALAYCAEKYGEDAVLDFLCGFAKYYFAPVIEDIKARGIPALIEHFKRTYTAEEALDLITLTEGDGTLSVKIEKCPAIEYMKTLGKEPSKYYVEETRTLYRAIAEASGLDFELISYAENGAAELAFSQK